MIHPRATRAFAPATVGNVACGFDIFGLALEQPGDQVVARAGSRPGVTLTAITGDDGRLSLEAERSTAGIAARALLEHVGGGAVSLEVHKGLPIASGLGGSAASAVAAAVAVDSLLNTGLSRSELLRFALEGERLGAGSAHADNVAASLYGGFVLVRSYDPPEIVELPIPEGLAVAVAHPHLEVQTDAARRLLGDTLPLKTAIDQWANIATLVAGLFRSDWKLISRSLVDLVAEPRRAHLVPGFAAVKSAAQEAGALGSSLSGSGPSVFALCRALPEAQVAGEAMQRAFREVGAIDADLFVSEVSLNGARIVSLPGEVP